MTLRAILESEEESSEDVSWLTKRAAMHWMPTLTRGQHNNLWVIWQKPTMDTRKCSKNKLQWTGGFPPEDRLCIQLPLGSIQTCQSKNKNCKLSSESLSWSILFRTKDLHIEHPAASRGNGLFKNQPIFSYFKIIACGWYLHSFLVIHCKLRLLRTQCKWLFRNFNNNFTVWSLGFKTPITDLHYCKRWGGQSQEFDSTY